MRQAFVSIFVFTGAVMAAFGYSPGDSSRLTQSAALADIEWLDAEVRRYRDAGKVPGVSIAVARGGAPLLSRSWGSIDLEGKRPLGEATRFRVASVTKPLTAAVVMSMVQAGRMDLDAPARRYCPEYPAKAVDPTIRHLLAHQSGLPHTNDADDTTISGDFSKLSDAVRYYGTRPLAFTPGSNTLYTSWGYSLLGCAIEGAAGHSFWTALDSAVFRKVGIASAARDTPTFSGPDFTPGYRPGAVWGMRPSLVVDTRFKTPASGLIISAPDLLRFLVGVSGPGLMSQAMRDEMFRPQTPPGQKPLYTLGWQISAPRSGAPTFAHSGSMEGVTAIAYVVPSRGDAVVVLANRERHVVETAPLARALGDRLFTARLPN